MAYDGWMNVGFMAGEMKNPQKNLPRAIITGILVVMVAYLAGNLAGLRLFCSFGIIANGLPTIGMTRACPVTRLFGLGILFVSSEL